MRIFEDEALDQRARDEAVGVYRTITELLPGNLERLKPATDFHFDLEAKPGSMILVIDAEKLVIIFEPSGGDPWIGEEGEWIGIYLPYLRGPNDTTGLPHMFAANKITFVHEYIHFLLKRREKPSRERAAAKYRRSSGTDPDHPSHESDSAAYYNHPQETNAYYQEAAIKMSDHIKGLPAEDRARISRFKMPDLVRWMYQFFQRSFIRNLTPENHRKLDKRLARFAEQSLRPALAKSDR